MQSEADEWKEYEDTKLDYTNLKIDTLKLDEDPDPNDDGDDVNEDGEKVKKSKEGGPWSKLVASDSLDKPSEIEEKTPGKVSFFLIFFLWHKSRLQWDYLHIIIILTYILVSTLKHIMDNFRACS